MYKKISNNKHLQIGFIVFCAVVTVILFISLASGSGASNIQEPNKAASQTAAPKNVSMERQIMNSATQAFQPSLETKENVDFILTPALLMQEVMSQDIVITYPTE
jgi:hypothetical protein